MSVQASTLGRAYRRVHVAFLLFAALLFQAGCADMSLFSPNEGGPARIALRPYFSENGFFATDVNVIRITVTQLPLGNVVEGLNNKEFPVSPSESEWKLPIDVPPNAEYEVLIVLVNRTNGVDEIVASGKQNISVGTGPQTPAPVPTFAGPPENLSVTNVTINQRDPNLLEGDQLGFTTKVDGPSGAKVIWLSSNPTVATVTTDGLVKALLPGTTQITASAGQRFDQVTLTVGPKVTQIAITPSGTTTVASFGADATFTGRVLDARNAEVPGFTISWSIADANIATQLSPGVFRARRNGTTTITATTTQGTRTITATATLKVEQKAVNITLAPTTSNFDAFGATQQFTVAAKDANGNDVSGLQFNWSSNNTAVATVDANGLVTAKGNGTAKIKVDAAGASAEADVRVQQTPATLVVSETQRTLTAINQTVQLRATVKDSRGNDMTTPISWSSTIPGIASVDANGLVTANGDGQVVITAQAGSQRGFTVITVSRTVQSVRLSESSIDLDAGNSRQLTATPVDANGFSIDNVPVTWATNNSAVATVTNTGLVTGLSAGTAEITAKAAGGFGVATVTVKGTLSGQLRVNQNGKVLLLNADGGQFSFVSNNLASTGLLSVSNMTDMVMGTPPPLSTLTQYGAIFVWTNFSPPSPAAWGDLLKNYVDAGGKVVLAVYAYSNLQDPWDIEGGIMSPGYSPLVNNNNRYNFFADQTLDFTTALVAHPVLAGVTEFTYGGNTNYVRVSAAPGATVVARDNNGVPLIGVSANGAVIGFNLYPGNAFTKSPGVWKAIANALK